MADNFGLKIGLEGEKEFKKALADINQSFKVLGSEMKLVTSQFDKNDSSAEALAAKHKALGNQIEAQKQKIETLRAALKNASDSFGENDRRTQNWQIQLNNAEAALNDMERELKDTSEAADDMGEEVEDAGDSAEKSENKFSKLGGVLKTVGAAMGAVAVAAGAAAVKLGKEVIAAYADYEQLVGGVDTLFKDSSQQLQTYAANAYKTAGLSANDYMETVTGFSASLIQSLGGDTEKAVKYADMAITDMSDNANKMGTDMSSIQNAYQGFAKQNYTMLDNLKLGYGGTKQEMERLLADAEKISGGRTDKYEEICEWYDGYRFGDTDIFNPWSVLNYMDENCSAKAYWQSTGDNSIIRQIVAEADDETADNLRKLMQGQMVSSYVDTSVIYPEIRNNPTTIYSFLLSAGYLKVVKKDELHDGNAICDIAIPNKEIFYVYEKEILSALTNVISQSTAIAIQQAIIKQDVPKLQDNLQKLLLNSISSFDYAHENFYHGLILGICAIMNNLYRVDSNRESGHGRYDIQLRPYDKKMPGIIIELKVLKDGVAESRIDSELEASAKEALAQIERQQYVTAMKQQGITHFFKVGVSFYKKHVKLLSDTE